MINWPDYARIIKEGCVLHACNFVVDVKVNPDFSAQCETFRMGMSKSNQLATRFRNWIRRLAKKSGIHSTDQAEIPNRF